MLAESQVLILDSGGSLLIIAGEFQNEEAGAMGYIAISCSVGFYGWDGGGSNTSSALMSMYLYGLCGGGLADRKQSGVAPDHP